MSEWVMCLSFPVTCLPSGKALKHPRWQKTAESRAASREYSGISFFAKQKKKKKTKEFCKPPFYEFEKHFFFLFFFFLHVLFTH